MKTAYRTYQYSIHIPSEVRTDYKYKQHLLYIQLVSLFLSVKDLLILERKQKKEKKKKLKLWENFFLKEDCSVISRYTETFQTEEGEKKGK